MGIHGFQGNTHRIGRVRKGSALWQMDPLAHLCRLQPAHGPRPVRHGPEEDLYRHGCPLGKRPLGRAALIVLAGILLSFIIAGYIVRIYRGVSPAPEFDNWGALYLDGIKLTVVGILWIIPLMAVLALMLGTVFLAGGRGASAGLSIGLVLVLVVIEVVLAVVTVFYSILGAVRFTRTGSIREGIRFAAITGTIRTIGWGRYVLALVILIVVAIAFFAVMSVFALVPSAGSGGPARPHPPVFHLLGAVHLPVSPSSRIPAAAP